jgi:hypothetical protein
MAQIAQNLSSGDSTPTAGAASLYLETLMARLSAWHSSSLALTEQAVRERFPAGYKKMILPAPLTCKIHAVYPPLLTNKSGKYLTGEARVWV